MSQLKSESSKIVSALSQTLRSAKPDIFDRDRPWHWNLLGFFATRSKYAVGNEWKHYEGDEGDLRCESCGSAHGRAVMIVNDPFDPETPVDFDSPTQVLCRTCVREALPVDSEYRDANVKEGTSSDLDPENLEGIPT